jgi:hypothetical protein
MTLEDANKGLDKQVAISANDQENTKWPKGW